MVFSRQRPGMLLNILQCTRQRPTTKNCQDNVGAEVEKPGPDGGLRS